MHVHPQAIELIATPAGPKALCASLPPLQAQGFHCGAMIDPPGHEWNNFTHEANELVTVVEGRMRFTLLDEAFELEPGGGPHAAAPQPASLCCLRRWRPVVSCVFRPGQHLHFGRGGCTERNGGPKALGASLSQLCSGAFAWATSHMCVEGAIVRSQTTSIADHCCYAGRPAGTAMQACFPLLCFLPLQTKFSSLLVSRTGEWPAALVQLRPEACDCQAGRAVGSAAPASRWQRALPGPGRQQQAGQHAGGKHSCARWGRGCSVLLMQSLYSCSLRRSLLRSGLLGDSEFLDIRTCCSTKNIASTNSKWFYGYDGARLHGGCQVSLPVARADATWTVPGSTAALWYT